MIKLMGIYILLTVSSSQCIYALLRCGCSPGPPGLRGASGMAGAPGESGPRGEQGLPGRDGMPGPAGANGAPGSTGTKGHQGDRGEKGEPGECTCDKGRYAYKVPRIVRRISRPQLLNFIKHQSPQEFEYENHINEQQFYEYGVDYDETQDDPYLPSLDYDMEPVHENAVYMDAHYTPNEKFTYPPQKYPHRMPIQTKPDQTVTATVSGPPLEMKHQSKGQYNAEQTKRGFRSNVASSLEAAIAGIRANIAQLQRLLAKQSI